MLKYHQALLVTTFFLIYKKHKRATQKCIRASHWRHINTVLDESLKEGNSKPFWKYVKSKRVDSIGISALKENGLLFEDSRSKAEILLNNFHLFLQEKTLQNLFLTSKTVHFLVLKIFLFKRQGC